jgi:hypothetical protein
MNRVIFIILLSCYSSYTTGQGKNFLDNIYNYLENTQVFELNQEEGHVPLMPYLSVNEALINDRVKSLNYLSLNGT